MRSATRALAARMRYSVPEQDLRIRPSHMPPRPESGFVIRDVLAAGG